MRRLLEALGSYLLVAGMFTVIGLAFLAAIYFALNSVCDEGEVFTTVRVEKHLGEGQWVSWEEDRCIER